MNLQMRRSKVAAPCCDVVAITDRKFYDDGVPLCVVPAEHPADGGTHSSSPPCVPLIADCRC